MKKIASTLLALFTAVYVSAAALSPQQALQRLTDNHGMMKAATKTNPRLVHTVNSPAQTPAVYIFNNANSGGFIILSADDVATPLLGYSDSGTFNPGNMPEAMKWWLDEYARQIQFAAEKTGKSFAPAQKAADSRAAIEPMIKTAWDQIEPYNDLCPLSGTNRTYTGCVATSMAQVMKYWQYPEIGRGTISYNDANLGKRLSMDFSKRAFDWQLMLPTYTGNYTAEQADAVAYLMRACGFSAKMNYSDQASAAYALNIADGMIKYFDYDPNTHYAVRSLYSASQWTDMIYSNLANVGPIIYGGTSMAGGGHSFICDGYDGNGYFHFNWGWSGMSDGYFLLDALTPSNLGAGGGSGGGYNFSQDAVLGIQPPTGQPAQYHPYEIVQAGTLDASIDQSTITFSLGAEDAATWLNYNPVRLTVTFGAIFEPVASTPGEKIAAPIDHKAVTLNAGYGTSTSFSPQINLADLALADGTYKVTFATSIKENENADYIPVKPFYGYYNYVTLTKQGDNYTVNVLAPGRLRIVDGGFENTIYYGGLAKVNVTLANDTDEELSCGLAPALYYVPAETGESTLYFLGSSEFVTVAPHSQVVHTWASELNPMVPIISMSHDAELELTFFDESTYKFFTDDIFKTVVMKPNPGTPNMALNRIQVPGSQMKLETVDGQPMQVFYIDDSLNIPVQFTTTLSGSIPFCYKMIACLLSSSAEGDGSLAIYAYNGDAAFINPGDPAYVMSTTLSYAYMKPGETYLIIPAYLYGSNFLPIGNRLAAIRLNAEAGIDNVIADEVDDSTMPFFNLQGINMGCDFNSLPTGIYIRAGKKYVKH